MDETSKKSNLIEYERDFQKSTEILIPSIEKVFAYSKRKTEENKVWNEDFMKRWSPAVMRVMPP